MQYTSSVSSGPNVTYSMKFCYCTIDVRLGLIEIFVAVNYGFMKYDAVFGKHVSFYNNLGYTASFKCYVNWKCCNRL
jgi:hypothetical protein